jgi:hypothetical protein
MTKTHLIADESLGGILREYVETDRKADVGERIVIANGYGWYRENVGEVYTVIDGNEFGFKEERTYVEHPQNSYNATLHFVTEENYRTLDPTDIVQIDGARFRMVERKAAVGEKVIAIDGDEHYGYKIGDILTVGDVWDSGGINTTDGQELCSYEFRVLEPLQSVVKKDGQYALYDHETDTYKHVMSSYDLPTVDATQASPEVIAMLANLAQRIVALEKAQEKQAEPGGGESAQVFPNIPTFKISDLHGKKLRIYSAQDIDGNIIATTTIGVDEATGQAYVIANKTEVIE